MWNSQEKEIAINQEGGRVKANDINNHTKWKRTNFKTEYAHRKKKIRSAT